MDDPFDLAGSLQDAWKDADLVSAGPARDAAAYRLAVAQGRCRVSGLSVPDAFLMRPLPEDLAIGASLELLARVKGWITEAATLGERWDACAAPAEWDELAACPLNFRHEAWIVMAAMPVEYLDRINLTLGDFTANPLLATIQVFDELLQSESVILATVTGTRLLSNMRASLAPEYRDRLPWWLDGTLEDASAETSARSSIEIDRFRGRLGLPPHPG